MDAPKLTTKETIFLLFLYFDSRFKLDTTREPCMRKFYDCRLAAIRNFLEQGYLDILCKVEALACEFSRREDDRK